MTITILGEPIAKMRARTFRKGGRTMTYDPQFEQKSNVIKHLLSKKKRTDFIQDAAYQVTARLHMEIPESFSQTKRNMIKWGFKFYVHPTRSDIDNLLKWIFDCGNTILWPDDRHITGIYCEKFYSPTPKTEIEVMEVPPQKIPKSIVDILNIYSPDDVEDLIIRVESISNVFSFCSEDMSPCNAEDLVKALIELADHHADLLKKISKKSSSCDKTKL